MSKRVVMFNHKGGVSKTTSVYNIAWKLAQLGNKVLVVDADSQCNLTSLILRDDFEKYYTEEKTKLNNIKDGVNSAFTGKPLPITAVDCSSPEKNPNLFLLAGHANLSEFDASLSLAQTSNNAITTLQNLPGAFNELISLTEEKYCIDYTLIDLNPSLSAINQNLFINSDAFMIPTNPDPFSIMALQTLCRILPKWASWKIGALDTFVDAAYPLRNGIPKFVGGLVQRFNIRNGSPAKPYRDNIAEIKNIFRTELFKALSDADMTWAFDLYPIAVSSDSWCFKEVPEFQALLPKSHAAGVPVFALADSDLDASGTVLDGLQSKRTLFDNYYLEISNKLIETLKNVEE